MGARVSTQQSRRDMKYTEEQIQAALTYMRANGHSMQDGDLIAIAESMYAQLLEHKLCPKDWADRLTPLDLYFYSMAWSGGIMHGQETIMSDLYKAEA